MARACPFFGRNSDQGKPVPTIKQRIAPVHQVGARLGSQEADAARDKWQVVGKDGLSEQSLGNSGTKSLRDGDHLVRRMNRAGADQNGDLLTAR